MPRQPGFAVADRFPAAERPTPSDFAHSRPEDLRRHVVENWHAYGYPREEKAV